MPTETKVRTAEVRFNGCCKRCKTCKSLLLTIKTEILLDRDGRFHSDRKTEYLDGKRFDDFLVKCPCGGEFWLQPVKGHMKPEVSCDARCTGAKGFSCDCSCGGKNHGSLA